ncbi:hypothetical protein EDD27_7017 [Nonomuraea polychroma]|uniref:Uncharacterized protein n=1 Tax=Nonomuraea polychroma TaxID=46176 RepID=A0A438MEY4_9ACTN|nr:hypothetical protein EDD27_7017 [Nonomuraea polychroma]
MIALLPQSPCESPTGRLRSVGLSVAIRGQYGWARETPTRTTR